jgi:hypothetical protein
MIDSLLVTQTAVRDQSPFPEPEPDWLWLPPDERACRIPAARLSIASFSEIPDACAAARTVSSVM